jgi:DNA-binding winged helix-turn-helix (wHTH) protein/tetratricopeptide (TPR) repeat protein/TolB-like protein
MYDPRHSFSCYTSAPKGARAHHTSPMYAPVKNKRRYRFGLFESDSAKGELVRQGVRVRLQDQPFRLLTILLERAGEVVSREELRQSLWPADTYVEFDGSLNAALKRLRAALGDSADNPIFIETVPKRGYRFIAPVAVEERGSEPPPDAVSAKNVPLKATPASTAPAELPGKPRERALIHGTVFIYGLALVIILLAGLGWYSIRHRWRPSASTTGSLLPLPVRKSVAILGFHNASGRAQDDWLGTAFSEMLSTELATGEKLRLVAGEEVANLRTSLPWSQTSTLGPETTARIGTALNSDVLVLGSYTAIGKGDREQLRLDVKLQNARTGEVLTQLAQTSGGDDLFRITSEIGAQLRNRLGVPGISDTEQAGVLASLPLNREGARFYALGIAKLREFDALAAKDLLEQATKADPKFSLAHAMLARAWSQLGYEQKRKEEAKKALDLSIDLPRVDRMQVEGDYYESLSDHGKAASTYRALFELFPDSVEYGLQLGEAQNLAAHASQARETVAHLRRLPPPASDDPRIDLLEARASSASFPERLALVRSAQSKAAVQGKKLVYAAAQRDECMYLNSSDHTDQALPACQDAYNLFLAGGNRLAAADTVRLMGDVEGDLGRPEPAIATYQRALKILQELGEHEKTGSVLNSMANVFINLGKLDRAEPLYRQAKTHFEQAGDKRNAGNVLANIGDLLYLRGNLPAAAKTYEQAIEMTSSLDDSKPGYVHYRLSDLELTRGHVQDAHRLVQQALDGIRPTQGDFEHLTEALVQMGEVLRAEGDLAGARHQFEAARDTQQKAGDMGLLEESQAELADLDLEEGHAAEAESLVRPAIAEFEKEKSDPATAAAYAELSQALLAQGKLDEARMAVQRATELTRSSSDPALKLPIAIQVARVEAAAGQKAPKYAGLAVAIQRLRSTIASARKLGYYLMECDARLALAEAELKTDPALGSAQLEILARETHERGLELLSRKAQLQATTSQPSLSNRSTPTLH